MKNKPSPPPAAAEPELSRGLRRYLFLTAATTGAAVMVVEILGAKMLSPYVGMSHFVWTAQIAVTLLALACGYYLGGRFADISPKLSRLYWAIVGAALYLALTVLICEPVAYRCLDLNLALGSLLASTILFFVPLALLAMTGPFLARVVTSSLAGVGSTVGRLTSIGTLGSFLGTMAIGYFMVPFFPNSVAMYSTALALILVALGYFLGFRRQVSAPLVVAVGLGLAPVWYFSSEGLHSYRMVQEKYRGNSHFGMLQVLERRADSCRYYLNDFLIQNTYDPERKQSVSHFTYMLSGLARVHNTNIQDVLCIGLGVGIVPMDFARAGARVDVVEINPAVVPVATQFFGLELDKIHLTIDDGRHFLNRCRKQYDAVILDAFLGDSSPSHLMTREAFASIRQVLRPGGVLTINTFGSIEEGRDFFTASLNQTLKSVFPGVRLYTSGDGGFFFVAADRPNPEFLRPPDFQTVHPNILRETEATYANVVEPLPGHGRVLTDNFNPAEFYDAKNREEWRRRLATGVRSL